MEALNKEEKFLLNRLLNSERALSNFFIESNNPRFVLALTGQNSKHKNIFQIGCPNSEKSPFLLPLMYLIRISERLNKEKISASIKSEYRHYIVYALKSIIKGIPNTKEAVDYDIVHWVMRIIEQLGIEIVDQDIFVFIKEHIDMLTFNLLARDIVGLIENFLKNKDKRGLLLLCDILEKMPTEVEKNRNIYYFVKDWMVNEKNICLVKNICDDQFILKISKLLLKKMQFNTRHIIENKIKMTILAKGDISVEIIGAKIKFTLPKVTFVEKQTSIRPRIKEELRKYDREDKEHLIELIFHFYTYVWYDLTYISYPCLYENPSVSSYKGSESLLIYLLKEMLCFVLQKHGLKRFLTLYDGVTKAHENFIFKRILLHCYAKNFSICKQAIWKLLAEEKSLLFAADFEAEIYELLNRNVAAFSKKDIDFIDHLIANGPYEETGWLDQETVSNYHSEAYKKMWQQERYAALTSNKLFNERYNELRKQTGRREFLNFRDGFKAKFITYRAAWTDDEALYKIKTNSTAFIQEMEKFEKKQQTRYMGLSGEATSIEGNIEMWQRLGKRFPQEITSIILNLLSLKSVYARYLLYGLRDCQNPQKINWNNLFKFIRLYLEKMPESRLSSKQVSSLFIIPEKQEKTYIMGALADLIPQSPKLEALNYEDALNMLEGFLKELLPNYQFDTSKFTSDNSEQLPVDYLTLTINTPVGRILEKYIELCEIVKGKQCQPLQDILEIFLEKRIVEAYVLFGFYFAYFQSCSKNWSQKISFKLFKLTITADTEKFWKMFFEGFMKGSPQYFEYYDEMYDHYKKAIEIYHLTEHNLLSNMLTQFVLAKKDKLDKKSLLLYCYRCGSFDILATCLRSIHHKINRNKWLGEVLSPIEKAKTKKILPIAECVWNKLSYLLINDLQTLKNDFQCSNSFQCFAKAMLGLMSAINAMDSKNYNIIEQLIEIGNLRYHDISDILSSLIELIKRIKTKQSFTYFAKIYYLLIQKVDTIYFVDQHKEIVCLLIKQPNNKSLQEVLDAIKAEYSHKQWAFGLEWFEKNKPAE